MKIKLLLALAAALLFSCAPERVDELTGEPAPPRSFTPVTPSGDPFQGTRDQAAGFYSKGSLSVPDRFPDEGTGFVKIARPRNRGFGTFDLVELLQKSAAELQTLHPSRDRIQIGDVSDQDGGLLSGHASHQNGLDADVAFLRKNQTEQDPDDTSGFKEIFVVGGKLTENFDMERNWAFAKILIRTGRVQRVFVNEVVKKAFCAHARSTGELVSEKETLRRLRVESGHTDHFHIRLTCPQNSPRCQAQTEVPDDSGCS